jgi:hypothetical protein
VGVADRPSVAKELGGGLTSKGTTDSDAGARGAAAAAGLPIDKAVGGVKRGSTTANVNKIALAPISTTKAGVRDAPTRCGCAVTCRSSLSITGPRA